MNARKRFSRGARAMVVLFVVGICFPAALAGSGFAADSKTVPPPKGALKPVAATGMGTSAAMDDPRCNVGPDYGPYGNWSTSTVGSGPACVVPFEEGDKNGGATAPGVTADSVKVVFVIPSPARIDAHLKTAPPVYRVDNSTSTYENVVHDYIYAYHDFYNQWGRAIDATFYQSSGTDETAQAADAVAIKALKPFAVVNFDSYGLDTLVNNLAKAKILVNSYSTSTKEAAAVAPYRWMAGSDADAAAASSAELIGKQLVGKKAEFGGDDVKGETRKIGLVQYEDAIDLDQFQATLKKYGGKNGAIDEANISSYPAQGGANGDPAIAQQAAPTIVQRMKSAGITTVVLFADRAMNAALMDQADQQGWTPEWFFTGSGYSDLPVLASGLSDTQSEHAFGISLIGPYVTTPPEVAAVVGVTGAYNWYWGKDVGSTSGLIPAGLTWILAGMHYAGPDLTVKNFHQGLFAAPPTEATTKNPNATLSGYGKTTGLPYEAYTPGPADFAAFFMDPYTEAISPGTGTKIKHASWYLDDAKRYRAGTWPKSFEWFDKDSAITERTAQLLLEPAPPCAQGKCPATGAAEPKVGASGDTFVVDPTYGAVTTSSS